ncbi:BatA domain-containing protein [Flagellimonas flava]|uniref:N-terminal double-transmembrane domain-containing protein n=1 Tax=Flagellimonas flava TaxID=570519 RepID=A0A1M5IZK6_9FLAO|nr:BatA domain-containing protein [Allomuricauda flava]SHG33744.1 N-terminal double-transmembrane domain-containing protein [Allomuricauda flava]
MQFKHPEILWALLLLLIPIFIHLFQLRRFKKTPFTNVAMLQQVVSESRKSNNLKKWFLLVTRMLLLTALVIAFAQPFSASETALKEKETIIYLDNSFSMQARHNGLSLLEKSVQDLLKNLGEDDVFTLFTNEETFRQVRLMDIQNRLLSLTYSHEQMELDAIALKANSLFSDDGNTAKHLVLISDFQQTLGTPIQNNAETQFHYVPVRPRENGNISLDSLYVEDLFSDQSKLTVLLSGGERDESIPVSLYNGEQLIAKSSATFENNGKASLVLSIPAQETLKGRVEIQENGLDYDNRFFFNIDEPERIQVLTITDSDANYLRKLYTPDEFELNIFELDQLDYSVLDRQNVVVLNQLKTIPNGLQQVLRTFRANGGTIIFIPASGVDPSSYNTFLSTYFGTQFKQSQTIGKKITDITFDHPLYENVFEKRVYNFQYPQVNTYYEVLTNAPRILSMEGDTPFLSGIDGFYFFTAPLELENTNFKSSPLIVPTFYNMAAFSLKMPDIYHTLGKPVAVDLSLDMGNDAVLNVAQEGYEFIPRQQTYANKVQLTFDENPIKDGIYTIKKELDSLSNISFNYPRKESDLSYTNLENFEEVSLQESVSGLFDYLKAENTITAYWKWFVILALLLALLEVIIQKVIR